MTEQEPNENCISKEKIEIMSCLGIFLGIVIIVAIPVVSVIYDIQFLWLVIFPILCLIGLIVLDGERIKQYISPLNGNNQDYELILDFD